MQDQSSQNDMERLASNADSRGTSSFKALFLAAIESISKAGRINEPFAYEPLKPGHIRVMAVIPHLGGDEQSGIECVLLNVDPAILPPYECLSYCWGPGDEQQGCITCNGRYFAVTRQLLAALWCLRANRPTARLMWVDQVCINQNDLEETSVQVQRMGEIYSNAARVLLFPGINERLGEAITFMLDFGDSCGRNYFTAKSDTFIRAWESGTSEDLYKIAKISRPEDERWSAVRAFLLSPCFRRTWIVQELALAREVRIMLLQDELLFDLEKNSGFGAFMTMLSRRYARTLDTYVGAAIVPARSMFAVRSTRLLLPDNPLLKLRGLLNTTRDLEYTDARDKVYALLSIASDAERLRIVPNHRMTVRDCYTLTARKILQEANALELLFSCHTLPEDSKWPTWVPDWRHKRLEKFPYPEPGIGKGKNDFKATGNLSLSLRSTKREGQLGLQGICIDKITRITSGPVDDKNIAFYTENVYGYGTWWIRAFDAIGPVYPHTGEGLARALGRTRIGDDQDQELRDDPDRWLPCTVRDREAIDACYSHGHYFHAVAEKVIAQTLLRNLFTTSRKYMGLAPLTAMEGDMVFLLTGANIPYILRHISNQEYRLIGQCYTHGIMFGEAADPALLQDIVLV